MLYKDLFEYLNQEHGLTILESDALEIERIVLKNHENKQLMLNGVVGRSELLEVFIDFADWYKDEYKQHIPLGAINEFVKSL